MANALPWMLSEVRGKNLTIADFDRISSQGHAMQAEFDTRNQVREQVRLEERQKNAKTGNASKRAKMSRSGGALLNPGPLGESNAGGGAGPQANLGTSG